MSQPEVKFYHFKITLPPKVIMDKDAFKSSYSDFTFIYNLICEEKTTLLRNCKDLQVDSGI